MTQINERYVNLISEYLDLLEEKVEKAKDKRAKCGIGTVELLFWQKRLENLTTIQGGVENTIDEINKELEKIVDILTTSIEIE